MPSLESVTSALELFGALLLALGAGALGYAWLGGSAGLGVGCLVAGAVLIGASLVLGWLGGGKS